MDCSKDMPPRTLNAVIHGRVRRERGTVEKAYFERIPNHCMTILHHWELFHKD
jgi:hypothetical protein